MITREQRKELKELAAQVGFKATVRGPHLDIENKCSTSRFASDETGYASAKLKLKQLINAKQHSQEAKS